MATYDILYGPSAISSLATNLKTLPHPIHREYVLIADPQKKGIIGCRDFFVKSVHDLGGEVDVLHLSDLENENNNGLIMWSQ